MPLLDDLREAMAGGQTLPITLSSELNARSPGLQTVFLHSFEGGIVVDQDVSGEQATILWLPWRQGELQTLRPESVGNAPPGTLFLTYELTGCKVLAISGGPVWHIDAPVDVGEFWPIVTSDEWVEDNWPQGAQQSVAYLHRAGQGDDLWDLAAHVEGGQPDTYGADNVGNTFVGGIVSSGVLNLYFGAQPWTPLNYAATTRTD